MCDFVYVCVQNKFVLLFVYVSEMSVYCFINYVVLLNEHCYALLKATLK
jgi:hypothetical protein